MVLVFIEVRTVNMNGAHGQAAVKAKNISTGIESTPRKEKWRANQRFVFGQRMVLVFIEVRTVKFCQTKVNINGAPGQVVAKAKQQSREQESIERQE